MGGAGAFTAARACWVIAAVARAACWLRVALPRRLSSARRGRLATAMPEASSADPAAVEASAGAGVAGEGAGPGALALASAGVSGEAEGRPLCCPAMKTATSATAAATAPPPQRSTRPPRAGAWFAAGCTGWAAMAAATRSAKPCGAGAWAWPRSTSPHSCQRSQVAARVSSSAMRFIRKRAWSGASAPSISADICWR